MFCDIGLAVIYYLVDDSIWCSSDNINVTDIYYLWVAYVACSGFWWCWWRGQGRFFDAKNNSRPIFVWHNVRLKMASTDLIMNQQSTTASGILSFAAAIYGAPNRVN